MNSENFCSKIVDKLGKMVRNKKEKYLNDKSDPKEARTRRNETRSPGKQLSRALVNKDGNKRKV